MYTLLKDNRIHANFSVAIGHKFCVTFSNAKDEAWSHDEHLHDKESLKSVIEYQNSNRI
ncbi:hypothetical protein BDR04DRAFT_1107123 [Suillus decipiens]|nr:hypothetical protein BDR04DRAFT_1107123 [Suillus decipiens]